MSVLVVTVYVCTVCGHVVDAVDMSPGRGCFGRRDRLHARAERVRRRFWVVLEP